MLGIAVKQAFLVVYANIILLSIDGSDFCLFKWHGLTLHFQLYILATIQKERGWVHSMLA